MEEETKETKPLTNSEYVMDYSEDEEDTVKIIRKRWTDEEERIFKQGLRDYGKNYNVINKLLETKSKIQILEKGRVLVKQIQMNPNDQDADLLPILDGPIVNPWMPVDIEKLNEARGSNINDL